MSQYSLGHDDYRHTNQPTDGQELHRKQQADSRYNIYSPPSYNYTVRLLLIIWNIRVTNLPTLARRVNSLTPALTFTGLGVGNTTCALGVNQLAKRVSVNPQVSGPIQHD